MQNRFRICPRGPCLVFPGFGRQTDDIEIAAASDRIMHQLGIPVHPQTGILFPTGRGRFYRQCCPVGDLAAEFRVFMSRDDPPGPGPDPVRPDKGLAGEVSGHSVALVDAGQVIVRRGLQIQDLGGEADGDSRCLFDTLQQDTLQVGPVDHPERKTVALLEIIAEAHATQLPAGLS